MIITLHTPKGIINIDSDIVTDSKLQSLGLDRDNLKDMIPRDLAAEIDELKAGQVEINEKLDLLLGK